MSETDTPDGDSASGGEIVAENASGEVKKKGWTGPIENRWSKGRINEKPSELLLAFRKVYRGNLSVTDMANPSIQTVQQLKLEDNAKFLTEFRTLSKEHHEKLQKRREAIAKTAEAAATVSRDKSTDDLLIVIDELLVDCLAANK